MKKKSILIAAIAFVIVAIVALVVFAFSNNLADDMKTVDLTGTWKVAVYFSNGMPTRSENEFFTFTEDRASAHKDGRTIATSKYTLTDGSNLDLPEISRKYSIEIRTENYIRLYESASAYIELIRYPNDDMREIATDISKIYGKWNVVFRNAGEPIADEVLVFTEDTIEDYRNGSTDPVSTSRYSWTSKNCLLADKWVTEFELTQFSDDAIFFIETESGLIWELHRAS